MRDTTNKIKNLREIASELNSSKRYKEAAKAYEQAIELYPEEKPALLRLAAINLIEMGKYDKAMELLEMALPLYLEKHHIYMDMSRIYVGKAKSCDGICGGIYNPDFKANYEIAISYMEKALQELPTSWGIARELEWYHARIGNYEKAIEYRDMSKALHEKNMSGM